MSNALQLVKTSRFEVCRFDCYQDGKGEFWGTREQIGAMLGYADPAKAIFNIHARNKARLDRFSSTLKLRGEAGEREATVYNFKGLLEICRYSNQPKADAVMDFLWDVADEIRRTGEYKGRKEINAPAPGNTLFFFYNGHKTRIVIAEAQPWIVARDIASAIGYNTQTPITLLFQCVPQRCRRHLTVHTSSGQQPAVCFTVEGGKIALTHSRKAEALRYLEWLNREVFPSVTGGTKKKLNGRQAAPASSTGRQDNGALNIEKIRIWQRMIESPAYELTAAEKKKLIKQIMALTA